jgi:outer membrane protein insertion porin family
VTISEVRILQATNTRRGFLQRIVKPLLSADRDEAFTLVEAREEIDRVGKTLDKLGMLAACLRV